MRAARFAAVLAVSAAVAIGAHQAAAQTSPDYPTGGTGVQLADDFGSMPLRDIGSIRMNGSGSSAVATNFRSGVYLYRWFAPLLQRRYGTLGADLGSRALAVRRVPR